MSRFGEFSTTVELGLAPFASKGREGAISFCQRLADRYIGTSGSGCLLYPPSFPLSFPSLPRFLSSATYASLSPSLPPSLPTVHPGPESETYARGTPEGRRIREQLALLFSLLPPSAQPTTLIGDVLASLPPPSGTSRIFQVETLG